MFRLLKIATYENEEVREYDESKFEQKIEYLNKKPPINIKVVCKNEDIGASLKFSFNQFDSTVFLQLSLRMAYLNH